MSRFVRILASIALLVGLVLGAPAARADDTPRDHRITRYDAQIRTDAGGTSTVTVNFDFDFGSSGGHGPFVTLPFRQEIADNPDEYRMIDVALGAVTSATGAPTNVQTSTEGDYIVLRIGREGTRVRGVQQYTLTYTARGLIEPDHATSGLDEFNFNVIGTAWQVPLSDVTATVTGPVAPQQTACFWGSAYDRTCQAQTSGNTATYSVQRLQPGQGFQVVAGYPAGTFTNAAPRYEKRYHVGNMFPATPLTVGLTGALSALGVALVWLKTRRWRRDEVYLGLTPGVRPAPGQQAAVGLADAAKAPVTVQFTPPKGATPGEVGVLLDTRADNVDVTATILDLAARGHMQIVEEGRGDWRFVLHESNDPLSPPELQILRVMFQAGPQVTTRQLRKEKYHTLLSGARSGLMTRVTSQLHWFKSNPRVQQALIAMGGLALIGLGVLGGFVLGAAFGLGLLGIAAVLAGVVMLFSASSVGRRTAEGSAVLAQARGFELYLRTAEADQIRFEEGIDVFSRYLPYATVFGVADRWAKVFEQLAREGRYVPATDWYVGANMYNSLYFASALNSMTQTLSQSMQSAVSAHTATQASSGGSGFSGGGGFGGGGGGSW